jgi:hypothetical protein
MGGGMTWVRIESGFFRHRKVLDLPLAAKLLFIGGLCYSAENGTDGHISKSALRVLAAELDVKPTMTRWLEDAGLWHKQADGHDIHDYLVYQPSADQERQRRQENADRIKAWREAKKTKRNGVRNAPSNSVTGDVTNDVTDGVRNGHVTLSPNPNPNPVVKSSSSEPLLSGAVGEEEEDFATAEARRRLACRQGPPVTNVEGWVRTVAANVRLEPKAKPAPTASPPDCATCKDVALAEPCPDCGRRAA